MKTRERWDWPRSAQGLPGPSGLEPPEESEKSPERASRGGTPRVPKECLPESQKSLKRVQNHTFGLFRDSGAHSFEPRGAQD